MLKQIMYQLCKALGSQELAYLEPSVCHDFVKWFNNIQESTFPGDQIVWCSPAVSFGHIIDQACGENAD